ncbi:hypothetical protein ACFY4B_05650 [Kitasatospora sp. NPDC001261]|uniref:hypothetical protein n=1 Tax=Kitasatospora sp. NPDC001261 TaxID=3364012 RepID=UPI00368B657B
MDDAFTLAWQYSAGLVFPEDLPMAAAGLLAAGIGGDSPALCDLAGRPGRGEPPVELTELLWQAMAELGLPVPDDGFVQRSLLHHTAARLVSGEITPVEAVAMLWSRIDERTTGAERRLAELVDRVCCPGCVDTWPVEVTRDWEREMRAAAVEVASAADHRNAASWHRG